MDARRFDALTRALSSGSRRGLLALLATLPLLGGLLAFLDTDEADARKNRRKRRKKSHKRAKRRRKKRKRRNKKNKRKCKRKPRAKICAGKCGIVRNKQTCKKRINCGSCAACSAAHPCLTGCCAMDGSCQPGTSPQACGVDGQACHACNEGLICKDGACQPCGDVCAKGCPSSSVQQAIDAASDGDVIYLCAETYQEPATITISKNLTLIGAGDGEDGTILDGQRQQTVLDVDNKATVGLQRLRITRGRSRGGIGENEGGGIAISFQVSLALTDCTVADNMADLVGGAGGGIFNDFGILTLVRSTVHGNQAQDGGGILNNGTLTLTGSTVRGNTATSDSGTGGGIFNTSAGALTLANSTVSDNEAGNGGGGILNAGAVALTGSTVRGNSASLGGGIRNDGGDVSLTASTVRGNTATGDGGGLYNEHGTVTLEDGSFICENTVNNQPDNCVGFSDPNGSCTETCPA